MIIKVGICLKSVQPLFYQGRSGFLTMKAALWNLTQLPLTAQFLCTRHTNPKLGRRLTDGQNSRQTDGQPGLRNGAIRHGKEEMKDDMEGSLKSFTLRQRSSFPKSVFAAGTAKRTAEMLKRKSAVVSKDEEKPETRTARGAGKVKPPDRPLSVAEWKTLKEAGGNPQRFDIQMMCALFNSGAELDIANLTEQKWAASWTTATPEGLCTCCGSELESIQLTSEEYQQLKDRVMTDIIQGRDVFNKTTPEELEQFKAFVKRKPAFDVVIDGLNVANINKDKSKQSETLLAVVSELERRGLVVLVLGRKHMLRPSRSWERHNMNLLQQKAHCFFTENISEDDPFLLYATLHSGNHCQFVSRDLMRDHKACLPDGVTRRLFFKWQRGHQLVVDGHVAAGRRVRFQSIPSYDTIVQTSGDSWHVPYDDTLDRSTYEVPQRWLCLSKKH
ncbi:mitochondrial ribonuclease P catalytic subunit isoform X2 [Channa argus]|uniref:mitochondrial ribonuclease P catalytic subunit isoform X2 n=1 Tax=Channa argus TaxID=215402 RepID=UPI003522B8B3